ncbi:squalene/phytoene synthase family protein [Arenibaculum sp.]|jgi:squalene synthase HpnC|uniref:squalene/phytoene synthase family protein n=1 Tax=Arenibaculum sp. TaxID=2865862 RepID=UPI002E10E9C0|nr:squalene/phytoene synthase family protein [Arenibaculum sp.]
MPEFDTIPPLLGPTEPRARKDASGENFPVASRLLPRRLRRHVAAFYDFVRLADDVADDPNLERETKLQYLDVLEGVLQQGGPGPGYADAAVVLRASLRESGLADSYARHLLHAFRRDARNESCRTWGDLMLYCRYSAVPVGRYMLALHGEGPRATSASDALCAALQIINHLQDVRDDWCQLGRCYIPRVWFDQAGISPEALVERRANPPLRAVLDRTLDQVDALLVRAAPLPRLVAHRGLRVEAAVILSLARALARRLRRRDPLAAHVRLPAHAKAGAVMRGIALGIAAR